MNLKAGILAITAVALSTAAAAATVDFSARINNFDLEQASQDRLVSLVVIDEASQPGRGNTFEISFTVTDLDSSTLLFSGSAQISTSQTQVIVGNNNTGRIELNYDAVLDRLEARFSIKAENSTNYGVSASAYGGSWHGEAQIRTGVAG